MVTNMGPVCSSVYRKRIKGPGLPMWPPPSPGDWPVLQTLTRRKTGEAPEPSGSVRTCISCPLLCVAGKKLLCMVCVALRNCVWLVLLDCAAMDLVDFKITSKRIDFIVGRIRFNEGKTRIFTSTYLVSMSISVCGSLGCYCSLWFPRDSTALIRSGSYTRRRWDDDLKNSEGSASTNRTPSYQRRLASAAMQISAKLPHLLIRSLFPLI